MAPSSFWKSVGKTFLLLGLGIGLAVGGAWVRHLLSLDPFARYRDRSDGPLSGSVAIRMDDVELSLFEGADVVAGAKVERIDVRTDRNGADFFYVSDGFFRGQEGEFHYAATRAAWNNSYQRLTVPSGAKVWNADMELTVDSFEANIADGRIHVPGTVRGRLFDGQVEAQSLIYSPKDGSYKIGPAIWIGLASLGLDPQVAEQPKKSKWTFKTSGATRSKGQIEMWSDAEATDGEVIVKAPRIERDVKTDVLTATGGVLYFSKKANLTCEKAVVFRKEKRAVLSGKVQMILKPEEQRQLKVEEIPPFRPQVPDEIAKNRPPAPPEDKRADDEVRSGKSVRKYPVTVLADKIEYWYAEGSRRAVIEGSPQARQEMAAGRWRYGWSFKALYDGELETLRLVSSEGKKDTRIKTSLGDDLVADWFEFSTKEDEDEWSAQGLQGDVYAEEDEVPPLPGQKKDTKAQETVEPPPIRGNIGPRA